MSMTSLLSQHRRPAWVQECSGEFIGVFIFCYVGLGSTAALTIGENTNQSQLSSVLQIGLAYAFGIAVAIITCGMSSGGHFSPAITVTFSLFKNFPLKKVPLYIASQIAGAFSATLIVYAQYRPYFLEIETRLVAAGKEASLFSSSGPAGVFAIYPNPGVSLGWTFLNEFFANIFIGLVVWACLDPSNVFVTSTSIPAFIGLAWALVIWGFDPATLSTNVARDVGARLGAIAIWGTNAWGGRYGAMSAFTPFLSTFLAACIYEFLLVDTSRVITASAKGLMENNERQRERKAYKCDQVQDRCLFLHMNIETNEPLASESFVDSY
ncbi:aquaporin-like protein [Cantharellus anzutake]|uniref:aquaporin-like protein n=1 Tax=Cantharellus anzutake TaxID=1750568 RepID=UPI0019082401|nr:aquaporin-like protein [Cantharellus anzutake]KAF8338746.1 aquaporin-like protein [Cantharellus anzutake]